MDGGRVRALVMASGCALVLGALGGCGAGASTVTETTTMIATATVAEAVTQTVTVHAPSDHTRTANTAPSTTTSTLSPTTAQSTSPPSVHDFSGNKLLVTVNGVIPATPAPAGFAPIAGHRLVALTLTLTDAGPGTISSDANTDATLIGSDGQTYAAAYDAVNECTNFDHGSYTLLAGATESGCVVFEIPTGVSDQSVRFSLGDGVVQFNKQ